MTKKSIILICILVILDQISKYIVTYAFLLGSSLEILPVFHITYAVNTGIAFSMFQGSNVLFIFLTAAAIALIIFWYIKNRLTLSHYVRLSILLIISGALGNWLDRIFRGSVVDFLDFSFRRYHWPAFNFSDSFITIGGIILFLSIITKKSEPRVKES